MTQTLHLFPNVGYLNREMEIEIVSHLMRHYLDKEETEVEIYDKNTGQKLDLHERHEDLEPGTIIDIKTKDEEILNAILVSENPLSVIVNNYKSKNVPANIIITKYERIIYSTSNSYNYVDLIVPKLGRDITPVIITKLPSFNWRPKYSLIINNPTDNPVLVSLTLSCKVNGVKFQNIVSINELVLHITNTQERRENSYHSYESAAPRSAMRLSAVPQMISDSDSNNAEQQDMSYRVNVGDISINALNTHALWIETKLDNFREIYCINISNGNNRVYRSFVFTSDNQYMPNGNVKVIGPGIDIIGVGNLVNSYMNEKLITIMLDMDIEVAIEVTTEQLELEENIIGEYNEQGYNVTGKTSKNNTDEEDAAFAATYTLPVRSTSPVIPSGSAKVNSKKSVPLTTKSAVYTPGVNGKTVPTNVGPANVGSTNGKTVNGNGGFTNVGSINSANVNKSLVPATPAPASFTDRKGTIVEEDDSILLMRNPYFRKSNIKIRERIQNTYFSIKLRNKKAKQVTLRLSYNYSGVIRRVEPGITEKRPGELIWEVKLQANETKIIHGAVKQGTILNF